MSDSEFLLCEDDLEDEYTEEQEEDNVLTVSYSRLRTLSQSPRKYKRVYIDKIKDEDTQATSLGKAIHKAILEPENFKKDYYIIPKPDRRTKAGKLAYAGAVDQAAENKQSLLYEHEAQKCQEAAKIVREHPLAGPLLKGAMSEVDLTWEIEPGLNGRAILDFYNPEVQAIGEVKVFSGMYKPYRFAGKAKEECYHVQAGWYHKAANVLELPVKDYYFLLVSAGRDPEVAVARADQEFIQRGGLKADLLCKELVERIESNNWTSYEELLTVGYVPW